MTNCISCFNSQTDFVHQVPLSQCPYHKKAIFRHRSVIPLAHTLQPKHGICWSNWKVFISYLPQSCSVNRPFKCPSSLPLQSDASDTNIMSGHLSVHSNWPPLSLNFVRVNLRPTTWAKWHFDDLKCSFFSHLLLFHLVDFWLAFSSFSFWQLWVFTWFCRVLALSKTENKYMNFYLMLLCVNFLFLHEDWRF